MRPKPGLASAAFALLLAVAADARPADQAAGPPADAVSSAEAAEPAQAMAHGARDPEAVTCRREVVTGSRVPGRRVCRTNREWEELAAAGNRRVRETLERMPSTGTREGMGPSPF